MWVLVFYFLLLQIALLLLLCLPLPSNTIRGWILAISKRLSNSESYKLFWKLNLFVMFVLFANCIRTIDKIEHHRDDGRGSHATGCSEFINTIKLFRNQRNAAYAGFNLLLSITIVRVLSLHSMLYESKSKLAKGGSKKNGKQGGKQD